MPNIGLVSCDKCLLYPAVAAQGSTHDSFFNRDWINSDKYLYWGKSGEIPLLNIADDVFLQHSWLLKDYKGDTKVNKENYVSK